VIASRADERPVAFRRPHDARPRESWRGVLRTVFTCRRSRPPVDAALGFVYLLNPATGPLSTSLEENRIDGPDSGSTREGSVVSKPSLVLLGSGRGRDAMFIFLAAVLDVTEASVRVRSIDGEARTAAAWGTFCYVDKPGDLFAVVSGVIQGLAVYFTAGVRGGEHRAGTGSSVA